MGDFVVEVETKSMAAVNHARQFRPDLRLRTSKCRAGWLCRDADLRLEPALRHKPVLFFSGMTDREDSVRAAWRNGPTEFLEKGVPASTIEETVRRILAERIKQYRAATATKTTRAA